MSTTRNRPDDPLPEYVPFPLYHGTSTLWEESIRVHGLGGRRIVEELRALEFHRQARACLTTIPHDWPVGTGLVMDRIDAQAVTDASFNFRHGGIYLTPSRRTATSYAAANPFGSELLTSCQLLEDAIAKSMEVPVWFQDYSDLLAILKQPGRPLLVRVDKVRTEDLAEESGQIGLANLRWLLDLIADSKTKAAMERDRVQSLRDANQRADMEMAAKLLAVPRETIFGEGQIIELFGQQVNFEAKVIFRVAQLEFEEIVTSQATQ